MEIHKRIHTNTLPYKCCYCDKKFRTSSNVRKHERSHVKLAEKRGLKPEEVQPRGTKFAELFQSLADELNNASKIPDTMPCISPSNLDTPQKIPCKTFNCEFCDKSFPKPSLLLRHEVVHTKIRVFECDLCHNRFNQKAALGLHMM